MRWNLELSLSRPALRFLASDNFVGHLGLGCVLTLTLWSLEVMIVVSLAKLPKLPLALTDI